MPRAKRACLRKCSGTAAVFGAANVPCAGPRLGGGIATALHITPMTFALEVDGFDFFAQRINIPMDIKIAGVHDSHEVFVGIA